MDYRPTVLRLRIAFLAKRATCQDVKVEHQAIPTCFS
jgi:hypothetical protein